ncbi:MAG: thioesterase II family protein [Rhabdochlamydiaceae bacterium]
MSTPSISRSWVTFPKPIPKAQIRLFCFPYAGSGASLFRTWPDELPSEVEVCPIQLPGREDRLKDVPFTQIAPLVETVANVIYPYLDKPFCFFGHSMGALIAFELTRHLHKQYELDALHLFISACCAPQLINRSPTILLLSDTELLKELHNLNGIPEAILQNDELMRLLLPVLRADFTLCETYVYVPGESLPCSLSILGGLEDREIRNEELAAWGKQTQKTFTLRLFPGDHFFLHSMRSLLLQAISQDVSPFIVKD